MKLGSSLNKGGTAPRRGYSLRDLLLVTICASLVLGLALPAIRQRIENQRQLACMHTARQLAIAVINYESTVRSFPLATDADGPLHKTPPGTFTKPAK